MVFIIISITHLLPLQNLKEHERDNCNTQFWNPGQKCLALGVIYTHTVIKQEVICIQICTLPYFFLIIKIKFKKKSGKHRRFWSVLTISILDKWHWGRGLSHPSGSLAVCQKKNNKLSVRYFNMKHVVINNYFPLHTIFAKMYLSFLSDSHLLIGSAYK